MTEKAAILANLIDTFDEHFKYNKKPPAEAKIQPWFVLQTGCMPRDMVRKARSRIDARIAERWPAESHK